MKATVLIFWRGRLGECRASLAAQPNGASAWIDRVRIRVLEFLLRRYDSAPEYRPIPREDLPLRAKILVLRPVLCRNEPSDQYGPRSRPTIAETLRDVGAENKRSAESRRWWQF